MEELWAQGERPLFIWDESVLMFQQEALTMPADEMVDGLLAQAHSMP